MPAPDRADQARKATRSALARDARRLAEEIEGLYIQLQQIGAFASIRSFMIRHSEGVPNFDLLHTAKALRCYAGVLLAARERHTQAHRQMTVSCSRCG